MANKNGVNRRQILVIDIGTHKAEEVLLFEGKPTWTTRNRLRILRQHRGNPVAAAAHIARINNASRDFARRFACRYVLVEPIMHRELCDFIARYPAVLIGGVSSCAPDGPVDLLLSQDSLGHSILPQKPNLTGESKATHNFEFTALYDYVVKAMGPPGHTSAIVVRMNAEGVEGPIISFLAKAGAAKPAILAGSLGDIRKCYGQAAYEEAFETLAEADIPFSYLTSHPKSWEMGLSQVSAALSAPH